MNIDKANLLTMRSLILNALAQAINQNSNLGFTTNGAVTHTTSDSAHVDLFMIIGSCRNNVADAVKVFERAYYTDKALALRILFWARDCRGGAGERKVFRAIMEHLAKISPADASAIMSSGVIEELGRYDDYVALLCNDMIDVSSRKSVALSIRKIIESGEGGLAAKWMPRKGIEAAKIRNLMGLTPKRYRKMLVAATNVVETKMCAKQWDDIVFKHVPSVAMARYTKAFARNAQAGFTEYKKALKSGAVKAKAEALFPYDVIRTVRNGDHEVADAQWSELPNYLIGERKILPIIDVSGSMTEHVAGDSSLSCMDVAVSLGIYISERQVGPFQNLAMTFHTNPEFFKIPEGGIAAKYSFVCQQKWGGATDLQAAFSLLLSTAINNGIAQEDMPDYLFIISDMEFNEATGDYLHNVSRKDQSTNFAKIEEQYKAAGYTRPNIIFWQVNARAGNVQIKFDKNGTAMISGFSPAIAKTVLECDNITPEKVMFETVMIDRYSISNLTV